MELIIMLAATMGLYAYLSMKERNSNETEWDKGYKWARSFLSHGDTEYVRRRILTEKNVFFRNGINAALKDYYKEQKK